MLERTPPEAQAPLWRVAYICLTVGWVLALAGAILVATAGEEPLGAVFFIGIPAFFTLVLYLFRRPPLIQRRRPTDSP